PPSRYLSIRPSPDRQRNGGNRCRCALMAVRARSKSLLMAGTSSQRSTGTPGARSPRSHPNDTMRVACATSSSAVMSGLLERGLSVTALHNHLNEMSPHVMYLHYSGQGDPLQLAQALRGALGASGTPFGAKPAGGAEGSAIDQKQVEAVLGRTGRVANGILQVVVGRAERITEHGTELPPAMGVATVLDFQ